MANIAISNLTTTATTLEKDDLILVSKKNGDKYISAKINCENLFKTNYSQLPNYASADIVTWSDLKSPPTNYEVTKDSILYVYSGSSSGGLATCVVSIDDFSYEMRSNDTSVDSNSFLISSGSKISLALSKVSYYRAHLIPLKTNILQTPSADCVSYVIESRHGLDYFDYEADKGYLKGTCVKYNDKYYICNAESSLFDPSNLTTNWTEISLDLLGNWWYRLYSDGFLEQGGIHLNFLNKKGGSDRPCILRKPYNDDKYTVLATNMTEDEAYPVIIYQKTNKSFSPRLNKDNVTTTRTEEYFSYHTMGYIDV